MLDEDYSCCDLVRFYCNVKLEYRPKTRNMSIPMVFLVSLAVNGAIINLMLRFKEWYPIYIQIFVIGSMLLLYFTLLKGPDRVEKKDDMELLRDRN